MRECPSHRSVIEDIASERSIGPGWFGETQRILCFRVPFPFQGHFSHAEEYTGLGIRNETSSFPAIISILQ